MKKITLFTVAIVFATQLTKAQTEKGTQNLGVDLSFLHQYESDDQFNFPASESQFTKMTDFSVGPSYSYFIASNLDLGASLNYSSSSDDNSPGNYLQRSYNGEVFLRKYFMYSDKFGLRVGPYAGYGKSTTNFTYPATGEGSDNKSGTETYTAGANLSLVYYPAKHLGLSATLADFSYQHYIDYSTLDNGHGNNFNLSLISSGVGISVFWVFGGI